MSPSPPPLSLPLAILSHRRCLCRAFTAATATAQSIMPPLVVTSRCHSHWELSALLSCVIDAAAVVDVAHIFCCRPRPCPRPLPCPVLAPAPAPVSRPRPRPVPVSVPVAVSVLLPVPACFPVPALVTVPIPTPPLAVTVIVTVTVICRLSPVTCRCAHGDSSLAALAGTGACLSPGYTTSATRRRGTTCLRPFWAARDPAWRRQSRWSGARR